MNKERLTIFTDAVLAIVLTLLVLELEQPREANLSAIWELRTSYFSYLITFFGLAVLWNNHHHIFQLVKKIDGKVLWSNFAMLLFASFFPYATRFVSTYFISTLVEELYGFVFLFLSLSYFLTYYYLVKADPENQDLRYVLSQPYKIGVDFIVKIFGLITGIFFPAAVIISTFLAMLIWVIPESRVENTIRLTNK